MIEGQGYTKYRTVLGDEAEAEFLIVTVMDTGSISWTPISEAVFNECGCADLPESLHGQVSAVYGKLHFSDDPEETGPQD